MGGKRSPNTHDDPDAAGLARDVHAALVSLGWVVPECDADVAQAEAELAAAPVPLPDALNDPGAVLDGASDRARVVPMRLPLPGRTDIDATLARAAREGGEIPPEIEQAMRCDREAAERDAQTEPTDPTADQ